MEQGTLVPSPPLRRPFLFLIPILEGTEIHATSHSSLHVPCWLSRVPSFPATVPPVCPCSKPPIPIPCLPPSTATTDLTQTGTQNQGARIRILLLSHSSRTRHRYLVTLPTICGWPVHTLLGLGWELGTLLSLVGVFLTLSLPCLTHSCLSDCRLLRVSPNNNNN